MDKQITKTGSAITGVIGFWLGSILGNIFTYLIAISGIVGWILGLIPQDQILVLLLFGIVLALLTVGLGGVASGVFNGWVLNRIDTGVIGANLWLGLVTHTVLDRDDRIQVSWCDDDGEIKYQFDEGAIESISSPGCLEPVEFDLDSEGNPHLVWYMNDVENLYGFSSPGDFLNESIRTEGGWSNAAIITETGSAAQPAEASQSEGALHLAWSDAIGEKAAINYARQDPYQCDIYALTDLGKVALATMKNDDFHPPDYEVPFCHNQYIDLIYQPNPEPAYSSDPAKPNGGFDRVAEMTEIVEYELLFINMEWDEDENNLSPGSSFARGIAD